MSKLILSIDDSNVIKHSLEMLLQKNGYETEHAWDGVEALEKVKQIMDGDRYISCIICDINMPNMDGLTFLKKIKEHPYYRLIPVLMLTTESDKKKVQQAKEYGATGWLVKPFQPDVVLNFVSKFSK